jgi:hypothetical protein
MHDLEAEFELGIDRRRVVAWILAVGVAAEVLLVCLDIFVVYSHRSPIGPFREIFWLTREETLGTWFAASQTLLVGLILGGVAVLARSRAGAGPSWLWAALAAIFVFLSADDAVQIHESVGTVVDHWGRQADGGLAALRSFPSYHWQLVFGLPLLALVYLLLGFAVPRLQRRSDRVLVIVAVVLLAVAVALDFLEGLDEGHPMNVAERLGIWLDMDRWTLEQFQTTSVATVGHFLRLLEEFIEMLAMTLLVAAFSSHLLSLASRLKIRAS